MGSTGGHGQSSHFIHFLEVMNSFPAASTLKPGEIVMSDPGMC